MEALRELIPFLLTRSLMMLVFAVGMDATVRDFLYFLRRPGQLVKAIVAVNVVVPVAAALLISLFPLAPVAKAAIMLMAVSPVPPLVPGKQRSVGGSKTYCNSLYLTLIVLAVAIVPGTVAILDWAYALSLNIPLGAVARNIALTVIVPLAGGMALRRFVPAFARRAAAPTRTIAMLILLVAFIPLLIGIWPAIAALIGNGTVVAMALVSAAALLGGHLLGGPDFENRAALAVTSATRHPGIAVMVAGASFTDKSVAAGIVCFVLVGMIVAIPYQIWCKRHLAATNAAMRDAVRVPQMETYDFRAAESKVTPRTIRFP